MTKLIGKKIKMNQIFQDDGMVVPVTILKMQDEIEGLAEGDKVKVRGTSKGKGFAGVVKRWGFAGGPKTHGQSDRHRAPGSIGAGTDPGRVWKGQKMAGRMGNRRVTIGGVKIIKVQPEEKLIFVKGAIPGNTGSQVSLIKI